jgi:hypothetical protein
MPCRECGCDAGSAEAGDDVAVADRVVDEVREPARRFERAKQRQRPLLQRQVLGVLERQIDELAFRRRAALRRGLVDIASAASCARARRRTRAAYRETCSG